MPSLNKRRINARPVFTRLILASAAFLSLFVFWQRPANGQMIVGRPATSSFGPTVQSPTAASPTAGSPARPVAGPVIPITGAMRHQTATTNSSAPTIVNSGAPNSHATFHTNPPHTGEHHHHHGRDDDNSRGHAFPVIYGFAYPYAVEPYAGDDNPPDDNADTEDDADYQGGPTVFDRRGSGEDSYDPPVEDMPKPQSEQPAAEATPQPATLLVFKDGHKIELENYAIVGATLFDLTPGHARRVALASLDLDATSQQNEDRGVIFQLPGGALGN